MFNHLTARKREKSFLDERIHEMAARNTLASTPVNILCAFMLLFALESTRHIVPLAIWVLAVSAISIARFIHSLNYSPGNQDTFPLKLHITMTGIQGALWGLAPVLFGNPISIYTFSVFTIQIVGISSAAILTQLSHKPSWLAFCIPTLGGLMLYALQSPVKGVFILSLLATTFMLMVGLFAARLETYFGLNREFQNSLQLKNKEISIKNEKLFHLAHYDNLTGAVNRKLLDLEGNAALEYCKTQELKCAFFHIDLDHFKHLNDTMGHAAGDALLQHVAKTLKDCTREGDIVARLGGDEFGVFIKEINKEDVAEVIAQKIVDVLDEPYQIINTKILCKASIGIAFYPEHGNSLSDLMNNSDLALQSAKKMGRGQYMVCTEDLQQESKRLRHVEFELRQALQTNAIGYHFQPILRAQDNKIIGAEALMRGLYQDDESRHISANADELLRVAETAGLMDALSKMLFDGLEDQGPKLFEAIPTLEKISINLSPLELRSFTPVDSLREIFKRGALKPQQIQVEITEQSVLERGADRARIAIDRLSAMGLSIVMDDFGTGYSSLTHLKSLPIDGVKIDKSFVSQLVKDIRDAAIVRSLIGMSKGLGLKVTAEGVEHIAQYETLRRLGCDYVQGWLFFKAESVEQIQKELLTTEQGMAIATSQLLASSVAKRSSSD